MIDLDDEIDEEAEPTTPGPSPYVVDPETSAGPQDDGPPDA